tara:strand:- start:13675 stop:14331 length:657 start_codon:yes stop_codon:yes gene_type:complete
MNIDKIYIINLKHRLDRKQHMLNELSRNNITNYEFFEAICPDISDIITWNNNYCNHVSNSFSNKLKFVNYQIGCLGCLKSHLEVCRIALKNNYKNILILEDDTEIIDSLNKLNEYYEQIPENPDMLYLCGSHLGEKTKISNNIIKVSGTHTTGSYIINNKTMKYLVDNITGYNKEIDVFYAEIIQNKFNCYCVIPHLAKQMDGYSDIQQTNVHYKLNV